MASAESSGAADIRLVPFAVDMADELISVWRESFNSALAPYRMEPTQEEHKRFLLEQLVHKTTLTVAMATHSVAGFMAQAGEEVEQLYIANEYQDRGLGGRFINLAREASPKRLHLFTFQRNLKARRFYQHHGFREIGYGYRNMEGLADVEMEWHSSGLR